VRAGAVVLAGGRSERMGAPKALLDWHGSTAVAHAVAIVREGIGGGPVCVVRAEGQELPPLDAVVVDDAVAFRGPLAALVEGLRTLGSDVELAFACGVDTPLLAPALVRAVCGALREGDDAVVPMIAGRDQPLLAAYRTAIAPSLLELLDRGGRSLKDISEACVVRTLGESELLADVSVAAADPRLRSAVNANTPEEWEALAAGLSPSPALPG
jgi:molybdenum cofactor guanylyltransferase